MKAESQSQLKSILVNFEDYYASLKWSIEMILVRIRVMVEIREILFTKFYFLALHLQNSASERTLVAMF